MSQLLVPLNGGTSQVQITTGGKPGVFLSPQYVQASKLEPTPTEWVIGGRPIYDRLPSASERYKLYFGLDNESAYVYIPVGNSYSGPGSLQVLTSGENKFLLVQGGSVVWEYGNIELDPVIIDLQLVGLRSTNYLIAYQLYFDDAPIEAQYSVEDYSMSGLEINVESSTDVVPGWRYKTEYAFTNSSSQSWRNYDKVFPSYVDPPFLVWQSEFPNSLTKVKLRCPSNASATGTASLYYGRCSDPNNSQKYCSSLEWVLQGTSEVGFDSEGQYFQFDIPYPGPEYSWRVEWSDPQISINEITVSGTITLKRRPSSGTTYCQLVAYPKNAVPSSVVNSAGEAVPVTYCNLAYADINNASQVTKLTDIRQTVGTNYQPIADWLTKPWDDNLIDLHEQVKNFPEYWLNPPTCMLTEYKGLEKYLVQVEE